MDYKQALKNAMFFIIGMLIGCAIIVGVEYASDVAVDVICGDNQSLVIYLGLLSDEKPRWECEPLIPCMWVEFDNVYYNGTMNNDTVGE